MKNTNKNERLGTLEHYLINNELDISTSMNNNHPVVYVQAIFTDADNDFKQEVELVYKVEYTKEVLGHIVHWVTKRNPFNKEKIYSDIRFLLVYQHLNCRELGSAILHFLLCTPELKRALKKYPWGGFKTILHFDMQDQESIDIEIVRPELLDGGDLQKIRNTEIMDDCFNFTLESKLKLLSDYHIEALKKLISLEISGKGIILYPTNFLYELNIPYKERKRFMEAFYRIKDCELIQISRTAILDDSNKYELAERGLFEYFFPDKKILTTNNSKN
jgi:hypothetical protein